MNGFLKAIFGSSGNAVVPGIFSFLSLLVSQFFPVPEGKDYFRYGAFLGILAGYSIGNACLNGKRKNRVAVAAVAVGAFIIGLLMASCYHVIIGTGRVAGMYQQLCAAGALGLTFLCGGILMPIAGIEFEKPHDDQGRA